MLVLGVWYTFTMKSPFGHYKGIILVILFIIILFSLFFFFEPHEIVNLVGVKNSYLILFLVAVIGGASSIMSSSYYATIITLAMGGLNPIIIALVAGFGLTLGDFLFYLLGAWGRKNVSGNVRKFIEKYARWLSKKPKRLIQLIVYVYTGFFPLPGDILMIALSFARFPYKSFLFPLLMGNITLVLLISFGVVWGFGLV